VIRAAVGLCLASLTLTACSPTETANPSSTTVAPTTSSTTTTTAVTTTTTAVTTTTTTVTTTTTPVTTTTTTTTTLPNTLDIDGVPLIEFSVEVDPDLSDELPSEELVAFVIDTLSDERSWTARGAGFRLVDSGGLFTITVATPSRVDQLCYPLRTNGRFSCARNGWVAINSDRWFGATDSWPGDLETYQRYLINHEVGHYLLGAGHDRCPGVGQPAPVMMQQTKGLNGCEPNGWVEPEQ